MAWFVMIGRDGLDGAERRNQHRAAHVASLEALNAARRIAFAGPIRDDGNQRSVGAVIVFEAETLEAARELIARDPYVAGGVFESWSVAPFKLAYPKEER